MLLGFKMARPHCNSFSSLSSSLMKGIGMIIIAFLFSHLNITHIQGSLSGIFAFNQSLYPLIGMATGPFCMSLWGITTFILHFSFTATISKMLLAAHVASSCGMLYAALLTSPKTLLFKRIFCACLVLLCSIAFVIHPVGRLAPLYACYWLIPFIIAFIPKPSMFLLALGSTFTCHAVGSVLWLYAGKLPSALAWNNLIPVVASERLVFACGSCILFALFSVAFSLLHSWWMRLQKPLHIVAKNKI